MKSKLNPLPPLLSLRAFESAGRLGTMTSAAQELYVTPGAISRQVRQLEQYLGVSLFDGPKNSPRLTLQGSQLLSSLTAAMAQINAGVSSVKSTTQKVINVSCLNTFAIKVLIPKLYLFKQIYPEIDVRVSTSAQDAPNKQSYDVILNIRLTNQLDTTTTVLFAEKLGPVLAPKLTEEYDIQTPQDLLKTPILQTKTRPNVWRNWCQEVGLQPQLMQLGSEFEHYYFTLEAAVGGLGICIAPEHLVVDDLSAGRLIAPLGFITSEYSYVAEIQSMQNQASRDFVSWLAKEVLTED
ncbi:MAG: LysR substrate-binding domain-containing protein [Hyphomicrobiales bacterium]